MKPAKVSTINLSGKVGTQSHKDFTEMFGDHTCALSNIKADQSFVGQNHSGPLEFFLVNL